MFYKSSPIKSSNDIKRGVVSAPVQYPDTITTPPVAPRPPEDHSHMLGSDNNKLPPSADEVKNDVKLTSASVGVPRLSPDNTKQLVYDRLLESATMSMYTTSPVPAAGAEAADLTEEDNRGGDCNSSCTSGTGSEAESDGDADVDVASGYFDDDEDHASGSGRSGNGNGSVTACVRFELDAVEETKIPENEVEMCADAQPQVQEKEQSVSGTTSQQPDEPEVCPAPSKYERVDAELLEFATFLGSISHPTSSNHSIQSLETLLNLPVETLYQQVLSHHEELEKKNVSFSRSIEPSRPLST